MPDRIADDAPAIAARMREIEQERRRELGLAPEPPPPAPEPTTGASVLAGILDRITEGAQDAYGITPAQLGIKDGGTP